MVRGMVWVMVRVRVRVSPSPAASQVMVLPVCGLLDEEEAPSPLLAWKARLPRTPNP